MSALRMGAVLSDGHGFQVTKIGKFVPFICPAGGLLVFLTNPPVRLNLTPAIKTSLSSQ